MVCLFGLFIIIPDVGTYNGASWVSWFAFGCVSGYGYYGPSFKSWDSWSLAWNISIAVTLFLAVVVAFGILSREKRPKHRLATAIAIVLLCLLAYVDYRALSIGELFVPIQEVLLILFILFGLKFTQLGHTQK